MGYLWIGMIILVLDQMTKLMAIRRLMEIGSLPIISNFFHLTYVENRGAAFGILQNQKVFFVIMTLSIVVGMLFYLYKNKDLPKPMKLGFSLIIAGAIGNLTDRLRLGYVVDFFDFRIFPVFNIADMSVVFGAILVSYVILKSDYFD